jgi:hypothetical protein
MKALAKMTTAKSLVGSLFAVALIAWTMTITPSANATFYDVSRSWSDGSGGTASLIGTVDVALGSYTIMNKGPSPFTSVSLTLIVNGGAPVHLNHADTSLIFGTGQFSIFATASSLIFDTANGNGQNPADLLFRDATNMDFYAIGSDGLPHFQTGIIGNDDVLDQSISFPNVFGTAASAPDTGSTLAMLSISLLGLGLGFKRLSHGSTSLTG